MQLLNLGYASLVNICRAVSWIVSTERWIGESSLGFRIGFGMKAFIVCSLLEAEQDIQSREREEIEEKLYQNNPKT